MSASKKRIRVVGAVWFGLVALLVAVWPSTALAERQPLPRLTPGRAVFDVGIQHKVSPSAAAAAAAIPGSLNTFSAKVTDSGKTYRYTMVGKNPAIAVTNASVTAKTLLVPLVIVFNGVATFDPTVSDSCDPGTSALTRTQQSPIFKSRSWTWGGTSIGTSQYVDAFQRANFWHYAQGTGINPTYHVTLGLTTLSPVVVHVPAANSAIVTVIGCGNGVLGAVDVNWLDGYLQGTVMPSLASKGLAANTFPIFLVHNVVEYVPPGGLCCILGYHNAFTPVAHGPIQTYAVSIYDNSHAFAGWSDIAALSHEVAEWVDDPYTNNRTRPWGHIGQVSGCQANLEVGDPLSGTSLSVTMGGFTYHPQELAFFSWFYRQAPSLGVNGWYSNNATFTSTQGTCA